MLNARKHTILLVSAQIKKNQQNGHFSVPFWNASSKRVPESEVKRVIIKRVICSVLVAKQKQGKPRPSKPECRGKDGRKIGLRRVASSGIGKKEQTWSEEAINKCFAL